MKPRQPLPRSIRTRFRGSYFNTKREDEDLNVVFVGGEPLLHTVSTMTAMFCLLGIYYFLLLPCPKRCNLALLHLQRDVLDDDLHEEDGKLLEKALKKLEK